MVDLDHPANRGILTYLGDPDRLRRSVSVAKLRPSCALADVGRPGLQLGTHPDLLARLWDELGGRAAGRLSLGGARHAGARAPGVGRHLRLLRRHTHTYALRLPPAAHAAALASGARTRWAYPAYPELGIDASVLDLADTGEGWVFGGWHAHEPDWCDAAYQEAGAIGARRT